MIWRASQVKYKDDTRYWRRWFCLLPRKVEGYKVWLETVEREQKYSSEWMGPFPYHWYGEAVYRLTEKQKIRIGKKW